MRIVQYIYLFFTILLLLACGGSDKIVIEGDIANPGNVKVVAFYEGDRKLDSVYLSDLDKFKFERPATQARLITINLGKNKYPVIVSPGEVLHFTTDLMNHPEDYVVKGSDLSIALQDFQPIEHRKRTVEDSLQRDFIQRTIGKSDGEIDMLRMTYLSKY